MDLNLISPILPKILEIMASGVLGNFTYDYLKSLGYYQLENLKRYFNYDYFDEEKFISYIQNEKGKRIISIIIKKVTEEIYESKLSGWGKLTSSIVSNSNYELNRINFYIKKYIEIDEFTLYFLIKLNIEKFDYSDVYTSNKNGSKVVKGKEEIALAQIYCSVNGFSDIYLDDGRTFISISELGKDFLNFILSLI